MPTVQDVLRESGFTDTQISELDTRAVSAFGNVLSQAQAAREQAELAQRSSVDWYENRIVPALTQWDTERARIDNERATQAAELAFYKTQNEEARRTGFIATDAPTYQPRDPQGRYVAGAPGATPGSPTFDMGKLYERAADGMNIIADIQWEHQRLFGKPLPVSPSELIKQADLQRLDPKTYASRTFGFDAKRQELQKAEQDKHDAEVARKATEANDRKWAERMGSNPDIRMPQENPRMTLVAAAVRKGDRPDPLNMTELERRSATRSSIRQELMDAER